MSYRASSPLAPKYGKKNAPTTICMQCMYKRPASSCHVFDLYCYNVMFLVARNNSKIRQELIGGKRTIRLSGHYLATLPQLSLSVCHATRKCKREHSDSCLISYVRSFFFSTWPLESEHNMASACRPSSFASTCIDLSESDTTVVLKKV